LKTIPKKWQLINNSKNLGFVKTANIGLKHSTGHSILLNSDTIVSENWLDRFGQVITSVKDLGTATPWSNNAEI
jgi:GT2 family glycosyltransferase